MRQLRVSQVEHIGKAPARYVHAVPRQGVPIFAREHNRFDEGRAQDTVIRQAFGPFRIEVPPVVRLGVEISNRTDTDTAPDELFLGGPKLVRRDRALTARSDQSDLAVYAARRSSDRAVTIVLINKNLHRACLVDADLGKLVGQLNAWRFDQETDGKIIPVRNLPKQPTFPLKLDLPAASATIAVVTP